MIIPCVARVSAQLTILQAMLEQPALTIQSRQAIVWFPPEVELHSHNNLRNTRGSKASRDSFRSVGEKGSKESSVKAVSRPSSRNSKLAHSMSASRLIDGSTIDERVHSPSAEDEGDDDDGTSSDSSTLSSSTGSSEALERDELIIKLDEAEKAYQTLLAEVSACVYSSVALFVSFITPIISVGFVLDAFSCPFAVHRAEGGVIGGDTRELRPVPSEGERGGSVQLGRRVRPTAQDPAGVTLCRFV